MLWSDNVSCCVKTGGLGLSIDAMLFLADVVNSSSSSSSSRDSSNIDIWLRVKLCRHGLYHKYMFWMIFDLASRAVVVAMGCRLSYAVL